jgi:tetratricopeptide (TPR) repeat protein
MTFLRGCVACFTLILTTLLCAPPLTAQESRWNKLTAQVSDLYQQGKYAEALPIAIEALKAAEAAFGPDDTRVATSLNNLATLNMDQGKYAEAEPLFERALGIDEKALGPDHPNVAICLENLAALYDHQGRYAEAEPLYQGALRIREKAFGPDDPSVAITLNNLALLYKKQEGKYAEAEPLFERALSIDEKALGPDQTDVATDLDNLAVLYREQGRRAEAEALEQRALRIREKLDQAAKLRSEEQTSSSSSREQTAEKLRGQQEAAERQAAGYGGVVAQSQAPPPVERFPNIEAPDIVTAGQEIAVQVSLTSEQIAPETKILSGAQNNGKLQLQMAEGEQQWTLSVVLSAPGMEIARGGTNTAEITIARDGDSSIALFYLRAQPLAAASPGGKRDTRILATLWHNGAFLARISRPLTIVPDVSVAAGVPTQPTPSGHATLAHASAQSTPSSSAALQLDLSVAAPDLTIIENRVGNTLRVIFYSSSKPPVEADIGDADELHAWINTRFAQMAGHSRGILLEPLSPSETKAVQLHSLDYLQGFGAELYDRFAPQAFKELFFKLLAEGGGEFNSIQIFSDDPALPWELMRPAIANSSERMDFLGTRFSIARWPLSHRNMQRPPQLLTVEHSVVIAPNYQGTQKLQAASQELTTLKKMRGFTEVSGDYAAVRELASHPPQGIVHFAGHGEVIDKDGVPQFNILLQDSEMDPATWQGLGAVEHPTHPLFFFNACDVGESRQFMNDVDGWAPALLDNGASGYIGALWPVSDSTAELFASTFYESITEGLASHRDINVAALLKDTRYQVFSKTSDATALAYVFYGDPRLVLQIQ